MRWVERELVFATGRPSPSGDSDPVRDRLTGLLSDLELNRPSSLLLHYRCAGCHLVALPDIRYSQFGVPTRLVLKYNIRAVRALGAARSDLAGLDEVVEGGVGDVQDLGDGGVQEKAKRIFSRQLTTIVSRTLYSHLSSSKTDVCLVGASRLSGGEGRRSGFGPSGDQGQPGQASVAVARLVGKFAVIEATGVLR